MKWGGILHLLFSDGVWPWVTETAESDVAEKGAAVPDVQTYPFSGYCILEYMKTWWMHVLHNKYLINQWEKTKLSFSCIFLL